jgi:hypothetical protein
MAIALSLALTFALPVAADEDEAAVEAPTEAPAATLGEPVASDTLADLSGGDETQIINIIDVDGDVTDNTATNVVTGANNIQNGSFDNASGVFSVVQNTGANVLIQSATIVNVQFAEP